jgi:hypothetical protein
MLFNFALENAIKEVHVNQVAAAGLCWWYNLLGDCIDTIKKNMGTLTDARLV